MKEWIPKITIDTSKIDVLSIPNALIPFANNLEGDVRSRAAKVKVFSTDIDFDSGITKNTVTKELYSFDNLYDTHQPTKKNVIPTYNMPSESRWSAFGSAWRQISYFLILDGIDQTGTEEASKLLQENARIETVYSKGPGFGLSLVGSTVVRPRECFANMLKLSVKEAEVGNWRSSQALFNYMTTDVDYDIGGRQINFNPVNMYALRYDTSDSLIRELTDWTPKDYDNYVRVYPLISDRYKGVYLPGLGHALQSTIESYLYSLVCNKFNSIPKHEQTPEHLKVLDSTKRIIEHGFLNCYHMQDIINEASELIGKPKPNLLHNFDTIFGTDIQSNYYRYIIKKSNKLGKTS